MTIAVFLDTNIFVSNYKMDGQKFKDLFNVHEELNTDDNFKLFITEMNFHEIVENYTKEINSALKHVKEFQSKFYKLADSEIVGIDRRKLKEGLIEGYKSKLESLFYISKPPAEAAENAVSRLYNSKMPFRDNKQEFKDAIIWESIYDYAQRHKSEKVYLISDNNKDFACEVSSGEYKLHSDYDDLDGRIKYFKTINGFLKEIDYLKTHLFSFHEKDGLIAVIGDYLSDVMDSNSNLQYAMHEFFTNNVFSEGLFEGWGTDYYINNIYDLEFDSDFEVLESDDYFYIPVTFTGNVLYSVEVRNPGYEPGDDEFLQSDTTSSDFSFKCTVAYELKEESVDYIQDVEIEFL